MEWLKLVHGSTPQSTQPTVNTGDEVRVWYRILEKGKERLGQFEGVVIRCRGSGVSKTFTVRRVTFGEGVERIFPFDAKVISRIEVLRHGRVRRARLYFLRTTVGKTRLAGEDVAAGKTADAVPIINRTADAQEPSDKVEGAVAAAGGGIVPPKPHS